MDINDLNNRFNYHAPDEDRRVRHEMVRGVIREIAYAIDAAVPDGREKSLAITKLEEAMFWANAGIAREGNEHTGFPGAHERG